MFYGAFIAPIALSLLYNLTILALILHSLGKREKVANNKGSDGLLYLVRVVVSLSMLLGLTWVFGILVVLVEHIAMQYIFAILNTFQGFLIFILHTARAKEVHAEWSSALSTINEKRRALSASSLPKDSGKARLGQQQVKRTPHRSVSSSSLVDTEFCYESRRESAVSMRPGAEQTNLDTTPLQLGPDDLAAKRRHAFTVRSSSLPAYEMRTATIVTLDDDSMKEEQEEETALRESLSVPSIPDFTGADDVVVNMAAEGIHEQDTARGSYIIAYV